VHRRSYRPILSTLSDGLCRLRLRTKRLPLPPRSHPPTGRAGPQGESEVNVRKPWQKWAGDKRVLIGIIAVLIFTIWIVLQWQYY
jgi:hypothetical protein